jgi:hypothetical protein
MIALANKSNSLVAMMLLYQRASDRAEDLSFVFFTV